MRETGMRGNASTCRDSGEKGAKPSKGPRVVGGRESTKGEEDVCPKGVRDWLDNHLWSTHKVRPQGVGMGRSNFHHIPMLPQNANYYATELGLAQNPAHQPAGNRSHARRGNHLRHHLLLKGRAMG